MNTDINDIHKTCYPSVTVDLNKLYDNTKLVTDACRKDGITVAGIVKGCNGIPEVGETMLREAALSWAHREWIRSSI